MVKASVGLPRWVWDILKKKHLEFGNSYKTSLTKKHLLIFNVVKLIMGVFEGALWGGANISNKHNNREKKELLMLHWSDS